MSLLAAAETPLNNIDKAVLCVAVALGLIALASIITWRRRR